MRTAAAIVGLLLAAATAGAQWPSWSKQFDSYDRGNQALSSAVERLSVSVGSQAWTNYMTTNLWASYFSQGAKLKTSKLMLKAAVDAGSWVRPDSGWTPDSSVSVTASNILSWAGAPNGWWTNHPYVNLAASSNGWRYLPYIASNIVWRSVDGRPDFTNGTESAQYGSAYDWVNCYNNAIADSPDYYTRSSMEYVFVYKAAYNLCSILWNRSYMRYVVDELPLTNSESQVYLWAVLFDDGGESFYFDAQGCNVSTSWWVTVEERFLAGQKDGSYFSLIPTNFAYPPTYSPEPDVGIGLGWDLNGGGSSWLALHKFNYSTNGFKWFR